MGQKNASGFSIGDGFRLGLGFMFAQIIFAVLAGVLWFAGAAALFGLAAVSGAK